MAPVQKRTRGGREPALEKQESSEWLGRVMLSNMCLKGAWVGTGGEKEEVEGCSRPVGSDKVAVAKRPKPGDTYALMRDDVTMGVDGKRACEGSSDSKSMSPASEASSPRSLVRPGGGHALRGPDGTGTAHDCKGGVRNGVWSCSGAARLNSNAGLVLATTLNREQHD
ncbi:hypothetical protein Ciccas_007668 [Cichlidogyrus casuarinus]|uniref:Uncharacterized protein n=1 Tax=Cichlidogyrus casuarinus TaxID=1844966 RepID=A0ABD2Q2B3_9PLAT